MNEGQRAEQAARAERIRVAAEADPKAAAANKKRWQEVQRAKDAAAIRANREWSRLFQSFLAEELGSLDGLYIYSLNGTTIEVGMADDYHPYSRADQLSTKAGGNVEIIDGSTGATIYTSDKWR